MKKRLDCILKVNEERFPYFFFFSPLTLQDAKNLCLHQAQHTEKSLEDLINLEQIQVLLLFALHVRVIAMQKISCGFWSLFYQPVLIELIQLSCIQTLLSNKDSANNEQKRNNLCKSLTTFLLCIWNSIKLLKINLQYFFVCCWGKVLWWYTESLLSVSAIQQGPSCIYLCDLLPWYRKAVSSLTELFFQKRCLESFLASNSSQRTWKWCIIHLDSFSCVLCFSGLKRLCFFFFFYFAFGLIRSL